MWRKLDRSKIQKHKEHDCPRRITKCRYCPLDMPYIEIWSHEQTCGAKTNKCYFCTEWIKKKEWDAHIDYCKKKKEGTLTEQDEAPKLSPKKANPTFGDYIPCPYCSDPFSEWDELQVHILCNHPSEAETLSDQSNVQNTEPVQEIAPQNTESSTSNNQIQENMDTTQDN